MQLRGLDTYENRSKEAGSAFQYKCMKRILRIRWPQTISHQQIQEITGMNRTSYERSDGTWIGHNEERQRRTPYYSFGVETRREGKTMSTKKQHGGEKNG